MSLGCQHQGTRKAHCGACWAEGEHPLRFTPSQVRLQPQAGGKQKRDEAAGELGAGKGCERALQRPLPLPRAGERPALHADEWGALQAAGPARPPVPSPRRARPPYHREHPRALHPTSRRPRRCKPLVTGAAAAEPNRSLLREMAAKKEASPFTSSLVLSASVIGPKDALADWTRWRVLSPGNRSAPASPYARYDAKATGRSGCLCCATRICSASPWKADVGFFCCCCFMGFFVCF